MKFSYFVSLISLCFIVFSPTGSFAERSGTVSEEEGPPSWLFPNRLFELGMAMNEVESLLTSRFPDRRIGRRKTAINNRLDLKISFEERGRYTNALSTFDRDARLELISGYALYFTSPLSQSKLYSIAYHVRRRKDLGALLPLQQWTNDLLEERGIPHFFELKGDQARALYYYGPDGEYLIDGPSRCQGIREAFSRLDEKSADVVADVRKRVKSSGCTYAFESNIWIWNDASVDRAVNYFVNFQIQADDLVWRSEYGLPTAP